MKTFPTPSKAAGMWISIHRIIVTDTIPVQNICESVIFGVVCQFLGTVMLSKLMSSEFFIFRDKYNECYQDKPRKLL